MPNGGDEGRALRGREDLLAIKELTARLIGSHTVQTSE